MRKTENVCIPDRTGICKKCCCAKHLLIILCCMVFLSYSESYAQTDGKKTKYTENKDSIVPFKTRWAIKTNSVEWALLLPNIGAEFDLSGSPYKHNTVNVHLRSNWFTPHSKNVATIYDLTTGRIEFRHYRRPESRNQAYADSISFLERVQQAFSWRRLNPKYWRAYYLGGYVEGGNYNFKFGETGHRGKVIGAGFSLGFGVPLHTYRNGALDLELGASLGVVYTQYDSYALDKMSNSYVYTSKNNSAVLPVISDARIAFVYRFCSIKDKYKYKLYDTTARERRMQRRKEKEERKQAELKADSLRRDSIGEQKTARKRKLFGGRKDKVQQAGTMSVQAKVVDRPQSETVSPDGAKKKKGLFGRKKKADNENTPLENTGEQRSVQTAETNGDSTVADDGKTKRKKKDRKSHKAETVSEGSAGDESAVQEKKVKKSRKNCKDKMEDKGAGQQNDAIGNND